MQHFPTVFALANANPDEVMHKWAGLGYYARARNLHKTAKLIAAKYDGAFPQDIDSVQALPGIGLSTAGAILAIAYNKPCAILDGNVKRVLTRFKGIQEPITNKQVMEKLWSIANKLTPTTRCRDYTQAIMDLGATICVRSKPHCLACPLKENCFAYKHQLTQVIPQKKSKLTLPRRTATFLILQHNEKILLCKRNPVGIWGGLWSLPEIEGTPTMQQIRLFCRQSFAISIGTPISLSPMQHTFSHYQLELLPIKAIVKTKPLRVMSNEHSHWLDLRKPLTKGLPKPILDIIKNQH